MRKNSFVALGSLVIVFVVACSNDNSSGDPTDTASSASSTEPAPSGQDETGSSVSPGPADESSGGSTESDGDDTATTSAEPGPSSETAAGGASSGGASTSSAASSPVGPTSSESETSEPEQPPPDAYEACSGTPLPAVALEPVILPPKVDKAIHMANPPGQPNMLYVAERDGAFKRFDLSEENPTATTLATLTNVSTAGEYGFLSFALHPNFDGESEKRAYLVYTPAQAFIIKEYVIEGDTATEAGTLFEFTGDTQTNHNGGLALFGPDGYLYVGIGDGGGGNDTHGANGNGQNLNTVYGKILRLDVDDPTRPVEGNLTSDAVDDEMVDGRILHYGLRNPWRFAFDRLTGDLYIGDVGQDTREEVDMIPADFGPANFGWAAREGFIECPGCSASLVGLPATDPAYDYENPPGNGAASRSVTGGYVYRGQAIPGLYGRYVFADYQTSVFTVLTADGMGGACDVIEDAIAQTEIREQGIASFAEDAEGELYVISLNDGIFKFVPGQ